MRISDWSSDVCSSDLGRWSRGSNWLSSSLYTFLIVGPGLIAEPGIAPREPVRPVARSRPEPFVRERRGRRGVQRGEQILSIRPVGERGGRIDMAEGSGIVEARAPQARAAPDVGGGGAGRSAEHTTEL